MVARHPKGTHKGGQFAPNEHPSDILVDIELGNRHLDAEHSTIRGIRDDLPSENSGERWHGYTDSVRGVTFDTPARRARWLSKEVASYDQLINGLDSKYEESLTLLDIDIMWKKFRLLVRREDQKAELLLDETLDDPEELLKQIDEDCDEQLKVVDDQATIRRRILLNDKNEELPVLEQYRQAYYEELEHMCKNPDPVAEKTVPPSESNPEKSSSSPLRESLWRRTLLKIRETLRIS